MNQIEKLLMRPRFVIYTIGLFVITVLIWSYIAKLDQVVVTQGKLKPRTAIQEIQSLEGGIIRDVYVKIGDQVEVGQQLLRLDDIAFKSALNEQLQQMDRLRGTISRFNAELAVTEEFNADKKVTIKIEDYFESDITAQNKANAKAAFNSSVNSLKIEAKTLSKRIEQASKDVVEARNNLIGLEDNLKIANEELNLNLPAYEKGAISGVEILKLRRAVNDTKSALDAIQFDIERKIKQRQEADIELSGLVAKFKNDVQEKLNEAKAELNQLETNNVAIQDKVSRAVILSPVVGIVKSVFSSTSGGVIQPGETVIEIVPFDKEVLVEVKILPQDIGFLKLGLPALIKLTAYDFVIYGGLTGELTHLSADTLTDEEGVVHYIGHVMLSGTVTDSGHVIEIRPGMQASVDIIAGNKTIMQYWLKPIIRAKASAMREM
ncbi:MAG: HlyD family type I secretion periplasmic adaptor subunit [Colwellia sp.]